MSDVDLLDVGHCLITGPTGRRGDYGGKSSLATWWCDEPGSAYDLVIFANFKHDDVCAVLDDYREVRSVDELADAMDGARGRFVLTPHDADWEAVSRRLKDFVQALGRRDESTSKLVVLDECPELDESAVLTFVRVLGNAANCDALCIAQSPTDVSTSIVKQCAVVWVGPVPSSYEAWFRTYDYHAHYRYIAEHHDPYEWTVILGTDDVDRAHYQAVPEVYAL